MAGRGRAPKAHRQNTHDRPARGDYRAAAGVGWQHGDQPAAPDGLMPASLEAWATWMGSWFAANWSADDLPGLRQIARLYDQVERGEFQRSTELRLMMDTYGITPKGQQDRRWVKPEQKGPEPRATGTAGGYSHLRTVG